MIHHRKVLDLEITDFEYHYDPTPSGEIIPSQTSNLKHVEIIKFQVMTLINEYYKLPERSEGSGYIVGFISKEPPASYW